MMVVAKEETTREAARGSCEPRSGVGSSLATVLVRRKAGAAFESHSSTKNGFKASTTGSECDR